MSIHMQALESQLHALYATNLLLKQQRPEFKELKEGWAVDQEILKRARPFAWSADTTRAVLAASQSIPLDTVLNTANLGPQSGANWWWFEEPLPFITNDSGLGVRAIGFARMAYVYGTGRRFAVPFHTWLDDPLSQFPIIPSQIWEWENNISLGEMLERTRSYHRRNYNQGGVFATAPKIGEDAFMRATESLSRFVLAGLAWLDQKIIVPEVEHTERHRRKDFNRQTGQDLDGVRVVRLRRRIYQEHAKESGNEEEAAQEKTREFTCQWVVDGHWRNQAHGVGWRERKLIYVMPYIKGPDNKPLKTGKKVYVVDR